MRTLNHSIFRAMSDSRDLSESAVIRHQVMQLTEADMDEFYLFLEERSAKSVRPTDRTSTCIRGTWIIIALRYYVPNI